MTGTPLTGSTKLIRWWLRSSAAAALLAILLGLAPAAAQTADDNPLRPPDTSSPRATLQGFIELTDHIYRSVAGAFSPTSRPIGFISLPKSARNIGPAICMRRMPFAIWTFRTSPPC